MEFSNAYTYSPLKFLKNLSRILGDFFVSFSCLFLPWKNKPYIEDINALKKEYEKLSRMYSCKKESINFYQKEKTFDYFTLNHDDEIKTSWSKIDHEIKKKAGVKCP